MRYTAIVLIGCLLPMFVRANSVVLDEAFADPADAGAWTIVEGEPGSRVSVDANDGRNGAGALVIENASATQPIVVRNGQRIAADPNAVLYVEGFVRIRSSRADSIGGDMALQVAWFDAADQLISRDKRGVAFSKGDMTGWCRVASGWVHAPHTPPDGAAYAQVEIVCQPPGGPVVIDDILG